MPPPPDPASKCRAEIAAAPCISERTVKRYRQKARILLRHELADT
jgi:DNA-directed RNA polymerase specialized sigma24 family protein